MRPPFDITPRSARLLSEIERSLGRMEGSMTTPANPLLRRSLRVRTIQASLQIEGNTLTEKQVTAMLEGKRVAAPERDLREARNAIACYDKLPHWKPGSLSHLLAAHKLMMAGLVKRPGARRSKGVGIAKGSMITHVAPAPGRVPGLMNDLLAWVKEEAEVPAPILAAVCHYEMEFIHPFEDGNGRIGRLWHSCILYHYHPVFAQAPVESAIRDRQAEYYTVLARCDDAGNSTAFVELALEMTLEALAAVSVAPQVRMTSAERIADAQRLFGKASFSRGDYLRHFSGLSPATASRDLQKVVNDRILARQGDRATARYAFK